ncbi:2-succinyl-5-enolpyruvyl-6-hydroxy-3-cyclohexene-1-carboxylic-acid synthase [Candidatus Rhabdochlamydia porcellionis]|uniref:2-succinyl-5-enolpyruvyl-6-hydroxy-3-cyclohexene-1-carboxylate synthase n=1 Tax=Candidatus Rhabdochlamydia porcellionis TaxID=225148 RepID=A0ABX8Z000_9BACT|nr:2-succinyl-5-enolpyruvyl-6-hydroxy-3-cyclohexene-1-carboxylic-acid synthase [Candidatus Rhabdochlamydia porcellionis]QZA58708.1 2-succinyl-5-enolpyruvyl-6-hydroxy-3- cyclohexene-1-carboxylate synthase [Candidatus Rhabdochlamydia porcellionis]
MKSIAENNYYFSYQLIDQLVKQGVQDFFLSPGSRSTPLVLAVANHFKARSHIHFDERGLAFYALGFAKASKKPVALIVTSGTAVGNLLPAVMEAKHDSVPLILLTADRPPELRDCGANQSCDQGHIFGSYVHWQIDFPCANELSSIKSLPTTIAQAVYYAQGPVHLNCMFREPLSSAHKSLEPLSSIHYTRSCLIPSSSIIEQYASHLKEHLNGVIIATATSPITPVIALAEKLNWPIFPDILSPLRTLKHPLIISHFDLILKTHPCSFEAVIQIGERFVSKVLLQVLEKSPPKFYLQVSEKPHRFDPAHIINYRMQSDISSFCQMLCLKLDISKTSSHLQLWQTRQLQTAKKLSNYFMKQTTLSEPAIANLLEQKNSALFLGNSMPIRDANCYLPVVSGPVFANRGLSGIDGNIATTCGIAIGMQRHTLAFLGDLSFLHDVNSLALVAKSPYPCTLIVINNQGGGIFSFLPLDQPKTIKETFFAAAHEISFSSAAKLFSLAYYAPQDLISLKNLLQKDSGSCIIELATNRKKNLLDHKQIESLFNTACS